MVLITLSDTVRKQIKAARLRKGFTLEEAAERVHMDKRNYQRIESGEKHAIDLDLIEQIAEGWEISYSQLLPTAETFYIQTANNGSGSVFHDNVTFHAISDELRNWFSELSREKDNTIQQLKEVIEAQTKIISDLKQ